jgi:transposase
MPPPDLFESQRRHLNAFFQFCPKAHELPRLCLRFGAMLRWGSAKTLDNWIDSATASGFPFVAQFPTTLRRDLQAVELSVTTPWSNGPIEDQINRLKAITK